MLGFRLRESAAFRGAKGDYTGNLFAYSCSWLDAVLRDHPPPTGERGHKEQVVKKLNVALIGYKFMGKAHSYALLATPFFFKTGIEPVRKVLVGRHAGPLKQAAQDFGWEECATDWREVVRRPDIDVVDIATPPNTHAEIAIAAAEAGKHIFCEKPFTVTVEEAQRALAAVERAGVKHMLGFNYRRVPAIGLAKRLIESGRLGKIFHFRAAYLQDWIMDPQFPRIWKLNRAIAGSGPHHELNSHIIDLALYLVGRINRVVGMEETFIKQRPAEAEPEQLSTMLTAQASTSKMVDVDVDDTTAFLARLPTVRWARSSPRASPPGAATTTGSK